MASSGSTIQNVMSSSFEVDCLPSGSVSGQTIDIASIPINSNGSFTSSTTQTGIANGESATLTYTFNGYFHGPNSSGDAQVTGIWREDISYTNGATSFSCTTKNDAFSATYRP